MGINNVRPTKSERAHRLFKITKFGVNRAKYIDQHTAI